jgi:hypothetical protein
MTHQDIVQELLRDEIHHFPVSLQPRLRMLVERAYIAGAYAAGRDAAEDGPVPDSKPAAPLPEDDKWPDEPSGSYDHEDREAARELLEEKGDGPQGDAA